MKKNIFPLLILALVSTRSFAQAKEPSRPVKTGNEWKMPSDAFSRAQAFAGRLTKALGLDTATSKKVYNAYLANTKPVDEITISAAGEEEKKARMKANQ